MLSDIGPGALSDIVQLAAKVRQDRAGRLADERRLGVLTGLVHAATAGGGGGALGILATIDALGF